MRESIALKLCAKRLNRPNVSFSRCVKGAHPGSGTIGTIKRRAGREYGAAPSKARHGFMLAGPGRAEVRAFKLIDRWRIYHDM
jgi:hypothetical protein